MVSSTHGGWASCRLLAASCRNPKRRCRSRGSRLLRRRPFRRAGFGLSRRVPYAHSAGCRMLPPGWRRSPPNAPLTCAGSVGVSPTACGILPQCKAQGAPQRKPLVLTALIPQNRIWPFQARSLRPFGRMPNVAARMAALPARRLPWLRAWANGGEDATTP